MDFLFFSWDCNYKFQLQSDGQLVLYNSLNTAIWSLQTAAPPNPNLEITQNGTINIWNENKDTIVFSSWNNNTGDSLPGMGDYELTVSNGGSVQLTNANNITLWAIYAEERWMKLSSDDEYLYLFINQCIEYDTNNVHSDRNIQQNSCDAFQGSVADINNLDLYIHILDELLYVNTWLSARYKCPWILMGLNVNEQSLIPSLSTKWQNGYPQSLNASYLLTKVPEQWLVNSAQGHASIVCRKLITPTTNPTFDPTKTPSKAPTRTPTHPSTMIPTEIPSKTPTNEPTFDDALSLILRKGICPSGFKMFPLNDNFCIKCNENESGNHGICDTCPDGTHSNENRTECVLCSDRRVGSNGFCNVECEYQTNELHTECVADEPFYGSDEFNAIMTVIGVLSGCTCVCGGVWAYFKKYKSNSIINNTTDQTNVTEMQNLNG